MVNKWLKCVSMALLLLVMTGCASDNLEKMIPADATGVVSIDVPDILKKAGMIDDGKIVLPQSLKQVIDANDTSPLCVLLNDLPQMGIPTIRLMPFSRPRHLGAYCLLDWKIPQKPARRWNCAWEAISTRLRALTACMWATISMSLMAMCFLSAQ